MFTITSLHGWVVDGNGDDISAYNYLIRVDRNGGGASVLEYTISAVHLCASLRYSQYGSGPLTHRV